MTRLPTLFISHGAPTFAIDPGIAGPALTALGKTLPRPKAVLVVSPHWMTREPRVATSAAPKTVHDFGGFPAALYELQYPAPGAPEVAQRAIEVLRSAGWAAEADPQWGLDHGAWVPLRQDYALEFSAWITQAVLNRDHARLQQTMAIAPHAQRAHPTPEHLWPLMVAAGAAGAEVPATRIEGGITHGVLAMDSYLFGALSLSASAAADALAA